MPISRDLYNVQIPQLGFSNCKLRRNVSDIIFLYDLLNGHTYSPGLLSLINFNIPNRTSRKFKLFFVPFYKNNYSSTSFFPRVLSLANIIPDHIDFFFMSRDMFKQNVYTSLSLVVI
jgi:hypothetical protein